MVSDFVLSGDGHINAAIIHLPIYFAHRDVGCIRVFMREDNMEIRSQNSGTCGFDNRYRRSGFVTLASCIILATSFRVGSLRADDRDCGDAPLTVSTEKVTETKVALSGLAKLLGSGEVGVNVNRKTTSLIT